MVSRARTITIGAIALSLLIWIWVLAATLFVLRWNSIIRPDAPVKELFPYGEIRIGVDASYPPFATATEDSLFGIDIDLGVALGKQLNIPIRFINMGYDGLYDSLKIDQVDMLISALPIDYSRSSDVLYTVPYFNAGLVLITPTSQPIVTMEDLSSHSLAFEFGSDANLFARAWLRRIAPYGLMPYETPEIALNAVRLGDSDAALVDAISGRLYLRQHQTFEAVEMQVSDTLFAIALSTKRGNRWRTVNEALKKMIDAKIVDEILNRWL